MGPILYLNTGDWVESCSAIVEHIDGIFELVRWKAATPQAQAPVRLTYQPAVCAVTALSRVSHAPQNDFD